VSKTEIDLFYKVKLYNLNDKIHFFLSGPRSEQDDII